MTLAPFVMRWRLVAGASFVPSGDTDLTLGFEAGPCTILRPGHFDLRDALLALNKGADEEHLIGLAGAGGAALFYYCLAALIRLGVLEASADCNDVPAVRLVPRSVHFGMPTPAAVPARVMLDRFAFLRRTAWGATLQHPDATCDLVFENADGVSLVTRLMASPIEVCSVIGALDHALINLLVTLGFAVDATGVEGPARRTWEFHDRLFQRAARSYDDFTVRGGTYRFTGALPAPPAIRPSYAGISFPLPAPQTGPLSSGRALRDVMESRRSSRAMSDLPVSFEAVGHLLHRVARVTTVLPGSPEIPQEVLLRPYPSGGAIHELEFYLAIRSCSDLAPGFYHYRGQEHALTRVVGAEAPAAAMLADCARAWGQPGQPPQVLVVISSRLPRLAWKYAGIAYKISLMNAGVAIQSLYLVATDLGLSGSAAGSGNPDLFAQATGVSSWEETSIAEFGFGRASRIPSG